MAYLHKKTFHLAPFTSLDNPLHAHVSTACGIDYGDYFHVDDFIALPIQVLNRKGYLTQGCCAGHPFCSVSSMNEWVPNICMIIFQKGILLPSLPPRFSAYEFRRNNSAGDILEIPITVKLKENPRFSNQLIIEYKLLWGHDENTLYKVLQDNVEVMAELYNWALELPCLYS